MAVLVAACTMTGCIVPIDWPTIAGGAATAVPSPNHSRLDETYQKVYEGSHFSIYDPITLTLPENERPSADGVIFPSDNNIALPGSNFLLTVASFATITGSSLHDFNKGNKDGRRASSSGVQFAALGRLIANLNPDTVRGLKGIVYPYALQVRTGYRLTAEGSDSFAALQPCQCPHAENQSRAGVSTFSRPDDVADRNRQTFLVPVSCNTGE